MVRKHTLMISRIKIQQVYKIKKRYVELIEKIYSSCSLEKWKKDSRWTQKLKWNGFENIGADHKNNTIKNMIFFLIFLVRFKKYRYCIAHFQFINQIRCKGYLELFCYLSNFYMKYKGDQKITNISCFLPCTSSSKWGH